MTLEQRHAAKAQRQNTRDSVTGLVLFISLVGAQMGGFREDTELVIAFQGFLTVLAHRWIPRI